MSKSIPVEPIVSVFNKEKLPSDWKLVPIGEICLPVQKVNPKERGKGEFDYIDISGIDNNHFLIIKTKRYAGDQAPSRARQLVKAGDIVFSTVRTYLKNLARVTPEYDGQIASTGFCVLRPVKPEFSKYLYYYLQYEPFLNQLAKHQRGTSYPAVRDGDVFAQLIPVPGENGVGPIVAEIEKQFSRLDEAVANLKRVKANLKRYKAAALKAAVEGKLVPTEAELARQEGRSYETGAQLLERILAERRQKWTGKGKYKEPLRPDTNNLPNLSEGWTWMSADQGTTLITDGEHITPRRTGSGLLLLSARNVLNGRLSLNEVDYVPQSEYDRISKRLVLKTGDVLLSCSGTVGRSTMVPEGLVFTIVRSVAVLKPVLNNGQYISIILRSPMLQGQINAKKTQTAQANIFQGKIKALVFPLPPLVEQHRIVAEVERRISVVEELEAVVNVNLQRATCLRQSILERAFEGTLLTAKQEYTIPGSEELPMAAESWNTYGSSRRQ